MRIGQPKGVVILVGVIVMTVVLLLVSVGISLLSYTTLRSSDTYDDALVAFYHADACMDEALLRLRRDNNYAGGTLTLNSVLCRIQVTNTGGGNRTILAEGEYNGVREAVQVTAAVSSSVTVSTWSRCPSEGNSRMSAASVTGVTDTWQRVAFRQCFRQPVIKAMHRESADTDANAVRIRNVTSSGFDIRLQNASGSAVTGETVYYLVVEEGAFTLTDGTKVEAHRFATNTTGSSSAWNSDAVTYTHSYSVAPVVFAQVMTSYDDVFAEAWVNGGTQTTPPSTTTLRVGLNVAQSGSSHGVEEIGWIAIDSAKDSVIGSTDYETIISGNVVQGHDNGCFSVNYAASYASDPLVIGNVIAMDDGDGGWLVQCALSTSQARVHVEEDQVGDAERGHAAEQVNLLILEGAFVHSQ